MKTEQELREELKKLREEYKVTLDEDDAIRLEIRIAELEEHLEINADFISEEPLYEEDYDSFSSPELEDDPELDEDATLGVIDKMKGKKKMRGKEDVDKRPLFIKWFEKYLTSVYSSFYTVEGKVTIKPGHEGGFVNMDSKEITLFAKLITDLWESSIPPLLVFYHEIGHVLYTIEPLMEYGKTLSPQMFNLLNWIEDFFVESELMRKLYFIKPYIKMLHEIVPDHIDDWEKPHFALHYYYCYEGLTPRWMTKKGIDRIFKNYIERLVHLRASFASKFTREKFIRLFEEFYMFCVKHGVLTKETPPPPLEPRPSKGKSITGGSYTGSSPDSGGTYGEEDTTEEASEKAGSDTYKDDEGEDVPESKIIRPPFKPLDPAKGFDPKFKELIEMMGEEYEKSLYDTFKLAKKGKPELSPRCIPTTSPRSMIDPIAIETGRSDFYLEYTTEEFAYSAYNLFIDVSGSVGHNLTFNTLGRDIIKIISHYPYAVYGYGNDVTKWDQKRIDDIMKLHCRDATESPIIGDIILEKKELGNLNIILSDGDLANLCRRKDIATITKQYLFVFIVTDSGEDWRGYAAKYFDPKQVYVLNKVSDLPAGIAKLQKYIKDKGL